MPSQVQLDNISVLSNPARFSQPFHFQVRFTTSIPLEMPIHWSIIYVGSALHHKHDQILDEFEVGPIDQPSTLQFDIQCPAPNPKLIPSSELLCMFCFLIIGVTAIILTASYRGQQFLRIGYYVHNQVDPEHANQPNVFHHIKRTIISDKPRLTKFNIQWRKDRKGSHGEESQSKLEDYFPCLHSRKDENVDSNSQKTPSSINQTFKSKSKIKSIYV